jgi:alcohol dehydrogenase class IV
MMKMQFEFSTASRIVFGRGKLSEIKNILKHMGSRVLLITGKSSNRTDILTSLLDKNHIPYARFSIKREPNIADINEGISHVRQIGCEFVVAIGGGSVIDAGKAIACLSRNEGNVIDYLEVIGRGKQIPQAGLGMAAIPTTAGTGSEVTRNSVIGAPEKKVKDLSVSMPAEITAYSGMDALTQLIEPFVSNHANPLTDALCLQGIKYAAESLVNVYKDGEDVISREKMSLASLFSGFALANAKLGAVHGFAGVIGGMFSAPHGAVCARLLAPVLEVNINSLSAKKGESPYLKRFDKIAQILTGKKDSYAQDMIGFVRRLSEQLEIPPLAEHGISEEDFPEIIVKAAGSSSMKGNPVDLNPDELYSIMEMAL